MDADEFVERFNKRNERIHEKLKEGEEEEVEVVDLE